MGRVQAFVLQFSPGRGHASPELLSVSRPWVVASIIAFVLQDMCPNQKDQSADALSAISPLIQPSVTMCQVGSIDLDIVNHQRHNPHPALYLSFKISAVGVFCFLGDLCEVAAEPVDVI